MVQRLAIKIGTINGVGIWVHYSWLFVLLYVTWVTRTLISERQPEWSSGEQWGAGAIIAMALFVSVLYREIARSLTTQRLGIRIRSVTLSIFGGSREGDEVYRRPGEEAGAAASGLLASLTEERVRAKREA